ncbi:segregation/condensation protein A [Streptomyces sp. NPDC005877]|uniref:segregation/condensation protein A n=1 Tax=Streptomyces sp. NPDC005877 TaxID=3155346 RepID=UPI0033CDCF02
MSVSEETPIPARARPPARARFLSRVPEAFAMFFAGLGLFCGAIALVPALRRLLRPVAWFLDRVTVPVSANLAYAVFLLLLAAAIGARKKVAWWLVVGYLGLLFLADVLLVAVTEWVWAANGLVCGAALLVLILARGEFYAETRRGAVHRALLVLLLGLGAGVLAGWALVEIFPGTLPRGQRLLWATNRVLGGLASSGQFDGRPPRPLFFFLGLFGAVALLSAATTLFRSQRMEAALHGDEEPRIRALLRAYGRDDSLGYFATRRDKAVVFSPSGKAAVTYRVEAGVALASGDPVGDPEAWGPAIAAWLDVARKYAWAPAVMGASTEGATVYARYGLGAIQLGDEAILHVARFDLDGREMRVTRQAVRRVARTGATTRVRRHSALTEEEMGQIVDRADAWRDTETERGFSMALDRLGDPADGDCLLVEAFDAGGRLIALLSFVPWGPDGISLDLMRRDRGAPNGVMEFMVAELCAYAPKLGVRRISLNFAVFRSAFEEGARIGAGPVLRLWRRLLLFFSKWWQLEALYRSNVKYQPQWFPRFLCYGDAGSLARVGLASGIAEGFVSVPSLRKLWGKGHAHIRAMGADWDLDQTTEFLVVAATLLDLKAARLLPAAEVEDEADLALLEARDLLFARLLQYRAYKRIADIFSERLDSEARRYPRTVGLEAHHAELLPEVVISIGPDGFAKLAVKAMQPKARPQVYVDHIHAPLVSVQEQAAVVVAMLREAGDASFQQLTQDAPDTLTVVARFLALLELYREKAVVLDQDEALGELMVRWSGGDGAGAAVTDEFDRVVEVETA